MGEAAVLGFDQFFVAATGFEPFPFQRELALGRTLPSLLDVPTGLGKTEAAVLAWLWRHRFSSAEVRRETPRRLIYCLPMRVLVNQTRDRVRGLLAQLVGAGLLREGEVALHVLMGGEDDTGWARNPAGSAILIGTQDMLLSRALNRGYGMSRYLWPVHYAWVHNDALWVIDETQIMGAGLATTAQLAGLRSRLGAVGPTGTLWMSATLAPSSVATIDHPMPPGGWASLSLGAGDRSVPEVAKRLGARKRMRIEVVPGKDTDFIRVVAKAVGACRAESGLTLVVVNRVDPARGLYRALKAALPAGMRLALLHGRMRPIDRQRHETLLRDESCARVVVSTQVVEAGVDVSAAVLVTELAPWPSLVQRFGRCNRRGELASGEVLVLERSEPEEQVLLPYTPAELKMTRDRLSEVGADVGPDRLAVASAIPPVAPKVVIRRTDVLDLFDTTPDLTGADLDVAPYIRDADEPDLDLHWENFGDVPPRDLPESRAEDRCRVSISAVRKFLADAKLTAWRWNTLDGAWERVRASEVRAGGRYLLPASAGGYSDELGWTGDASDLPSVRSVVQGGAAPGETYDDEHRSFGASSWVSLRQHSGDVERHARALTNELGGTVAALPLDAVHRAALWHDAGKAHPAFQRMLGVTDEQVGPQAKSPGGRGSARYAVPANSWSGGLPPRDEPRPGFRHELVSALAWLCHHGGEPGADLVAYLVAAHHGKVRTSIRSLPTESRPADPTCRFARGVWDGDVLPAVDLPGEGRQAPTRLSLGMMEMGLGTDGPSWADRVLRVRQAYGPFRLSFLESLVRVADWRASAEYDQP